MVDCKGGSVKKRTLLLVPTIAAALATTAAGSPAKFSPRVDNPWFPLRPGTTYVYRGVKDGQPARDVVTVTRRVKTIQGAPCVVVRDLAYLSGKLRERTTDWYTQDAKGNVWYFGEDTAELDTKGRVKTREGSWQSGRDGAKAGIFMFANPRVGRSARQEYYKGHAEDWFRVLSLHARVKVPYTSSQNALLTKEWSGIEAGVIDHKFYVRGIGNVREQQVKGGTEHFELVSVRR
jgi:hypothetical protein